MVSGIYYWITTSVLMVPGKAFREIMEGNNRWLNYSHLFSTYVFLWRDNNSESADFKGRTPEKFCNRAFRLEMDRACGPT